MRLCMTPPPFGTPEGLSCQPKATSLDVRDSSWSRPMPEPLVEVEHFYFGLTQI